ncbi:sulfatase-like hydrolase/transferase [Ferruginibacter sp. SUN106]|uniref:sulfatase-like hydrolase/transferase n=1 Tax=Ferruginibacter sp. SUN106 TaxID=2978348 RepID=UPI003D36F83D
MKLLKTIPWFLFLLVLFFVAHGAVENFGFIYFSEVIKIGLTIVGCIAIFFLLTRFFVKNIIHAALIVFFISAWLLFFGAVFDWVRSVSFLHWLHSYSIFVPFMCCTFIAFILLIRKKESLRNKLCFYLNVLLLIYCIFDLVTLGFKAISTNKATAKNNITIDAAAIHSKPNIYFLLFDGYPGYKSLQDSFAFANDSLYHFFEVKGFKVLPTFSNYNMTYYSMSSMLNMQYIDKPFVPLANTAANDQQRIKEIKNAELIRQLKNIGYRFTNYSIFDIADQPSVKGNSFVVSQATLLTHKIFFNKILKDIGWHFISGKYSIPFIKNIYMGDDRNNKFIEEKLTTNDPGSKATPKFVYAHLLLPHPPLFCDSMGNYLPTEQIFDPQLAANRPLYLSYLKYANKKMQGIIESIGKNDPGAIVIVMSDHGYRDFNIGDRIEPLHFNNICAVHFPDSNYLPMKAAWSNVNFFRYLLNCEFNQKLPYLADSSIFLRDIKTAE